MYLLAHGLVGTGRLVGTNSVGTTPLRSLQRVVPCCPTLKLSSTSMGKDDIRVMKNFNEFVKQTHIMHEHVVRMVHEVL
jgi:hypothetical protein